MNAALEIWNRITDLKFELRRDGEDIGLYAPLGGALPNDLFEALKAHKSEILDLLRYQEQADALLLESTRRLSQAWPKGCPLETPEWKRLEGELHRAYWTLDRHELAAVIRAREQYALRVFEAHRTGKRGGRKNL